MWAVLTVIAYLLLALLIPMVWALGRTWRRTRNSRNVTCPELGALTEISLDSCYAVRMHAIGEQELRVRACARWPEHRDCGQNCLSLI